MLRGRVAACVALVALAACQKDASQVLAQDAAPTAASAPPPADHLAKGELLEGPDKAFSLTLPKGTRVDHAYAKVVFASGPFLPEDVANYVRARVRDGSVVLGASATSFTGVRVPASPDVVLDVRVQPGENGGTAIEVRDSTPAQAPDLPDEESRWRAAGLKPNGQPLDPLHMQ